MHTVNFIFKNTSNSITLIFKAFKNADDIFKKAIQSHTAKLSVEDDYELVGLIDMSEVSAVTMSDFSKEMDRNGEMGLIQHKSQLKAQNNAKNDVGLQILSKSGNALAQ